MELTGTGKKTPRPAPFSNFGDWVDVCADGVDVVSSFEAKPYQDSSAPYKVQQFNGEAVWSGTSFAAAHVSGRVAGALQPNPKLDRQGVLAQLASDPEARPVPTMGWFVP